MTKTNILPTVSLLAVGDLSADEAEQLTDKLQARVAEELRKIRREFRTGDDVVDRYGNCCYISHVYKLDSEYSGKTEYELRDYDGERCWKAARESDIAGFRP